MKYNEHVGRANSAHWAQDLADEAIRQYSEEEIVAYINSPEEDDEYDREHTPAQPTSFEEWLEQTGDSI